MTFYPQRAQARPARRVVPLNLGLDGGDGKEKAEEEIRQLVLRDMCRSKAAFRRQWGWDLDGDCPVAGSGWRWQKLEEGE